MPLTYTNPVWPGYFADPFVLRVGEEYFAYGTGEPSSTPASGKFQILRSANLAHWSEIGTALAPSPERHAYAYWAPEVAEHDGTFFLYYSSAPPDRDELHRIHVARASSPTGPFVDAGAVLSSEEGFSIDAHPFRDPRDGRWYLFFAKDYFEARVGTGLAVVPLDSTMLCAADRPRPVLQANADWQIYQRNRALYGREWDAWHTVEGPCVVMHEDRYYCFYSGGNWQTHEYGVSYAVAPHPLGPWQHAPHEGPIVLRQIPGQVLGPGHNSYVRKPDGVDVLVYHAWDPARTARRMFIDPLIWGPEGPRCRGPSTSRQTL